MKHLLASILNHKNATEDMVEKAVDHPLSNRDRVYIAHAVGSSKTYSRKLFDKHINDPEKAEFAACSRHFNKWVNRVGFDAVFSHPNPHVTYLASNHQDFNKWIDQIGFDAAFNHPCDDVHYGAARHPGVNKYIDEIGIKKALWHPSYVLRELALER